MTHYNHTIQRYTGVVVLVTGGTGLFGKAIEHVVNEAKVEGETWYFASSKDANLKDKDSTKALFDKVKVWMLLKLYREDRSMMTVERMNSLRM